MRYGGERADDVASSARDRAIGSASQRQESLNKYHNVLGTWTWVRSETAVNALSISEGTFDNHIDPLGTGPQQTFPSFLDGSSFRVPQGTTQNRFEIADAYTQVLGSHTLRFGGGIQWIDGKFDLDVFRAGRIEYIQDFPAYDANGDGRVNDDDTLFAVTLRSGHPDQGLVIDDADNTHFGAYSSQDDWRVLPHLTINAGLRYEIDTDVKNISRYDEINPIVKPFLQGDRNRDLNNLAPRIGFNWAAPDGRTSITGGYGIYYDRITLEIESLERGLDGRALPIEVRAGNVFFIDPSTGQFPPFAPTTSNPFTGFILPGAGAGGINIIDNTMQNPTVQQFSLGVERQFGKIAGGPRQWPPRARHAVHHRPQDRRGVQPGRRRPRSGREPRVERRHELRRAAAFGRAARLAQQSARVLHAGQGVQLRQRRSDPVFERADRSE